MKAIVTGSSRGLGLELARKFAEGEWEVCIASRSAEGLDKAKSKLAESVNTEKVIGFPVDFSNAESVTEYCQAVKDRWGEIDLLINNVGIYVVDDVHNYTEENLLKSIETNVMSAMRMTSAFLDAMKARGKGHIVNIVSIAAIHPRSDALTYSMSKAALKSFNDVLRKSVRKTGVKVTAIYPGSMSTSSWDGVDVDRSMLIQVEDVSQAVFDLVKTSSNTVVEELIINTNRDF